MELSSSDLAEKVAKQMMEQRIILNRTSETVLRFLPPYILQREHVDITIAALDEIFMANTAYANPLPAGEHING
jgi:acetylornithine/N-succinyldiaminopimelate aminotransferase